MQITGSYQGYTKQQNLAALQNFLKQQTQNKASTPNSQSWQSKKDSVEISQQGQQAWRESQLPPDFNLFQGPRKDKDAWLRELQQSIKEQDWPELTPEQKKEQQFSKILSDLSHRLSHSADLSGRAEFNDEFKNVIEYALNKLGIDFQDMNEIEIGLNGNGRMTVSGLKSESDNKKLAEELIRIASLPLIGNKVLTSVDESVSTPPWIQQEFYYNTDFAMSADDEQERNNRAFLIEMKDRADRSMKEKGIDLDFMQLYRTEDGKIAGYPEETAWYFEADIPPPTAKLTDKEWIALAVRRYANMFLDAGYDNIPNVNELNVVFKFNQGSFVDLNASV